MVQNEHDAIHATIRFKKKPKDGIGEKSQLPPVTIDG